MSFNNKDILMQEQEENIDEIGVLANTLRKHALKIDEEIEIQHE